jgi:ribosomal protein S18 acetylase RimI-like enzyme
MRRWLIPVRSPCQRRAAVGRLGLVENVEIADMRSGDVDALAWSGGPRHLAYIRETLFRADRGEAVLLVARSRAGACIGMGSVDFAIDPAAGRLWMLVVHSDLRSRGVGTQLIAEMEERIRSTGRPFAELLVEKINVGAARLYERLGYEIIGEEITSWEQDSPTGLFVYEADCLLMRKHLS